VDTIVGVEAFEVTVPIEAPLRHSYGVHEAFTRTVVILQDSEGRTGLAETAASSEAVRAAAALVLGVSPFALGVLRSRLSQQFYWSSNPLITAAFEMAAIDLQGQILDLPASTILGGALRTDVSMAAYCFFRYESATSPAIQTPDEMAAHAADLCQRFGYETVKLKAGTLPPDLEVAALAAIRSELPHARLRIDPNAAWTPATAMRLVPALEEIGLEYLEDPAPLQSGMAQVRTRTSLPLATNMVVTDFPHLSGAIAQSCIDVVLSDPWYWGGPTQTQSLAQFCHVMGLGVGMHSGIELGIGMATMLHTALTIPNLTLAMDAHYHHLADDIIAGPRLLPSGDGTLAPPEGAGWGVRLDPDKVAEYRDLYASGKYANLYVAGDSGGGADRRRPGWFPVMPAW
jgi:glucarate dehydratase